MIDYFNIMEATFTEWVSTPKCRFAFIGDDQSVHNYLYYTKKLLNATAVPFRTGMVNTVGGQGSQIYDAHVEHWKKRGMDQGHANNQAYEGVYSVFSFAFFLCSVCPLLCVW